MTKQARFEEMNMGPQSRMREYLQLVATGPELSKSLNEEQAEDAMAMILDGEIDSVRAGIFLIALRMKRETQAENIGVLNALTARMEQCESVHQQVMAVADPFNGYLRCMPATPFLPAVLAACGLPTYIHGLQQVGPKYGITARMIFEAAGASVDSSSTQAVAKLDDEEVGWTYIDQKNYIPKLHELVELRDTMVKRSCLSTLEVVLRPIQGAVSTHLLTGFVHKAYPPVYAALAQHVGFESAAIIKGVEGGCVPSLSQVSRYFSYTGTGDLQLHRLSPVDFGVKQDERLVEVPKEFIADIDQTTYQNIQILKNVVKYNLTMGVEALRGSEGPMYDSLIYAAAIGLKHVGLVANLSEGVNEVRNVLTNGEAIARFEAGCVNG